MRVDINVLSRSNIVMTSAYNFSDAGIISQWPAHQYGMYSVEYPAKLYLLFTATEILKGDFNFWVWYIPNPNPEPEPEPVVEPLNNTTTNTTSVNNTQKAEETYAKDVFKNKKGMDRISNLEIGKDKLILIIVVAIIGVIIIAITIVTIFILVKRKWFK